MSEPFTLPNSLYEISVEKNQQEQAFSCTPTYGLKFDFDIDDEPPITASFFAALDDLREGRMSPL